MKNIPIRHITPPQLEPELSGSFSIRNITTLLSREDMTQDLHRHDFFYILVLEKAKGQHQIDFVSYPIGRHSIFFMRPGQVHQLQLKKRSSGFLIQFNTGFYSPKEKSARQVLRKVSSKNYCRPGPGEFKKFLSILDRIFNEYTNKEENYKEVIKASLGIFFIELARQSQNLQSNPGNNNLYAQERLEELQELIAIHIATDKQVANYAARMHLSTYQLNIITKSTIGKTCSTLIDEQVILEAKRYLLATSYQVSQIADQLGYEDVSYFIRFFKKHTGYSPEAFRHNYR